MSLNPTVDHHWLIFFTCALHIIGVGHQPFDVQNGQLGRQNDLWSFIELQVARTRLIELFCPGGPLFATPWSFFTSLLILRSTPVHCNENLVVEGGWLGFCALVYEATEDAFVL